MDTKRLVTGAVVGGLTLFVLGYLIYGMLLENFFASNATADYGRESMIFWSIGLGEILMATLVTLAIGWSGASGWMEGAKTGALVGFLAWGAVDFIMYGAFDMTSLTATVVDPLVEIVRHGIAGAVIAIVVARGASTASAPASEY